MARQPRIDVAGTPYHVINRSVGRLRIFKKDSDYQLFIDLLIAAKEKAEIDILAFIVMPNHWHLVVIPKNNGDMQKFMHALTNAHTRKVHTWTQTTGEGPLYQGRYKSFIINQDAHLLAVIKYVERNPVRAGLCKVAEVWKWGSAWIRVYGTDVQRKLLSEGPVPLPNKYQTWLNTQEGDEVLSNLRNAVIKSTPFGNQDWVEVMVGVHNLRHTTRAVGRPKGSKNH